MFYRRIRDNVRRWKQVGLTWLSSSPGHSHILRVGGWQRQMWAFASGRVSLVKFSNMATPTGGRG